MGFTKKLNGSIVISTIHFYVATIFITLLLLGCSKDDDGGGSSSSLKASATSFTLDGVNNCDTSLGTGTLLFFETPYTASESLNVNRLLVNTKVSNGETEESSTTTFQDNGSAINWVVCFTYGTQDWVEYEVRLRG